MQVIGYESSQKPRPAFDWASRPRECRKEKFSKDLKWRVNGRNCKEFGSRDGRNSQSETEGGILIFRRRRYNSSETDSFLSRRIERKKSGCRHSGEFQAASSWKDHIRVHDYPVSPYIQHTKQNLNCPALSAVSHEESQKSIPLENLYLIKWIGGYPMSEPKQSEE